MEIGGYDLVFDTPDPKMLAKKIMKFVGTFDGWSDTIIEEDDGDDFFWYKDMKSKLGWDKEGAIPELANTMIYFLIGEEQLTVVVDKEMAVMIREFMEN